MRNILIVDDNKANRMILKALMDDYLSEHNYNDVHISQAENGLEAVKMAQETKMDLIFMDIMMPEMDGIAATEKIKQMDKRVMVVAVSALDDEDNKRKILQKGAEDYIVKPISTEVLKRRLNQYMSIINARSEKHKNYNPINIIDSNVYNRRTVFLIQHETALAEFWEYYMQAETTFSDMMIDMVRILYGLGAWQLKLKYKFEITVEESRDNLYFTMNNMKLLKHEMVEKIVNKNYPNGTYWLKEDKLSFSICKDETKQSDVPVMVQPQESVEDKAPVEPVAEPIVTQAAVMQEQPAQEEEVLQIFDFMEMEDIDELQTIVGELNSLMLLVGSSSLEDDEVLQIAGYIDKFARILSQYGETYDLYTALNTLSIDIQEQIENFKAKSKDIGMLCVAFNNDLDQWQRKLFHEGAPSVDFLDSSIISNANMISGFIKPQEDTQEEIDDIFDF